MNAMKRYIIAIIGLMLCCGLKAQTRTCQYWFDGDIGQSVTTTFSGNSWDAQFDVSQLADGIHTLHLHIHDTVWNPTQNFFFRKVSTISTSELSYYYWFDNDLGNLQNGTLGDGMVALEAESLSAGLHTLHLMVKGDDYSSTRNYLIVKTEMADWEANLSYHCWFDQDLTNAQTGLLGNGNIILDATDLEEGEHIVHIYLEGSNVTAPQSYVFAKGSEAPIYEITTTVIPADAGTVTGAGAYYEGNTCILTAIPNEGCGFVCWKENGNVVSEDPVYTFTVTDNRTLVAQFSGLNVDENEAESLMVYPNPAKDRLTVESKEVIRQCKIYDLTGHLVNTLENDSERMEFSVEALPAGIYVVRLVTDRFTPTRWFIKK